MPALRLGVLASGRGTDLQSILDATLERRIQSRVEIVLSDQAGAPVLERARRAGVAHQLVAPDPALAPPERRQRHEDALIRLLDDAKVDLVVLAGYMRLVSSHFVGHYPNRIVNVHPALLPAFPGLRGQRQALAWGVRIAGCTTHFVDEKTDHGPVLLQAALPVRPQETEESLSRRILAVEHQILPRTIHLLEQGRVKIEGRHVRLDPDESWTTRYPVLPDVLYGPGY